MYAPVSYRHNAEGVYILLLLLSISCEMAVWQYDPGICSARPLTVTTSERGLVHVAVIIMAMPGLKYLGVSTTVAKNSRKLEITTMIWEKEAQGLQKDFDIDGMT